MVSYVNSFRSEELEWLYSKVCKKPNLQQGKCFYHNIYLKLHWIVSRFGVIDLTCLFIPTNKWCNSVDSIQNIAFLMIIIHNYDATKTSNAPKIWIEEYLVYDWDGQ